MRSAAATSLEHEAQFSAAAALLRKDTSPDEIVDVRVTCDGTWSRRGHQAKYGVVVVASWETGFISVREHLQTILEKVTSL